MSRGRERRRDVVVVTDADRRAQRVVVAAAARLGLPVAASSRQCPTRISPAEVIDEIARSPVEPVVVLADDGGASGRGPGERLIAALAVSPRVRLLAVVAVASNTVPVRGVDVEEAVTSAGRLLVRQAVDKRGRPRSGRTLQGDTVDVLTDLAVPVVGVGDPGRMGSDDVDVIALALREAVRLGKRSARRRRSHGTTGGGRAA
jgi:stage V sporulation protein AE